MLLSIRHNYQGFIRYSNRFTDYAVLILLRLHRVNTHDKLHRSLSLIDIKYSGYSCHLKIPQIKKKGNKITILAPLHSQRTLPPSLGEHLSDAVKLGCTIISQDSHSQAFVVQGPPSPTHAVTKKNHQGARIYIILCSPMFSCYDQAMATLSWWLIRFKVRQPHGRQ